MLTLEEVKAIVIAEKEYWDKSEAGIGISGTGACCNIYAALCGFRAPWHPQKTLTAVECCPQEPTRFGDGACER